MNELIQEISLIIEENQIPKNVKVKLESAIKTLKNIEMEESLRANKALQDLDDLSDDPNIPSYIRTELWNIISQLETF